MVNSGVHARTDAAVGAFDAFKHIKLPQRLVAVHELAVQFSALRLRFAHGERLSLNGFDVKVQVDFRACHPARVAQLQWHQGQFLGEQRRQVQPFGQMFFDGDVKAPLLPGRALIQTERPNVHGRLGGLQVQKRGIQAAECVHEVSGLRCHALGEAEAYFALGSVPPAARADPVVDRRSFRASRATQGAALLQVFHVLLNAFAFTL